MGVGMRKGNDRWNESVKKVGEEKKEFFEE